MNLATASPSCRADGRQGIIRLTMSLAAGTKLDGYEILGPLGAGGMGEVYRARDAGLKRDVAIKVLPPFVARDPDRLRRFEQEAQAAAALNHPNILAVYQFGSLNGSPYLVSELLLGETLREMMNRGAMPVRKVIEIGVQIAHGLSAAHEKGIIHRDLKPENFFVTKDGRVKILDFGLAKLTQRDPIEEGRESSQLAETDPGMLVGTAGYMSPEQVRGKVVDHRTDIFSFGGILYEMLAGRRAFQESTWPETMTSILKDDPPSFSQLAPGTPPGLQRVILRCLEKSPEQRFQSASDLAFALEAMSESGMASVLYGSEPGVRGFRQTLLWLTCLLAIVAVAGVGYLVVDHPKPGAALAISGYDQITHDGHQKVLVGTDGSRLYFNQEDSDPPAEVAIAGGEIAPITIPIPNAILQSVSPDGSSILVGSQSIGQTSGFPLWSTGVLGGTPRSLADSVTHATWSPDGKSVAYAKPDGDIFEVKARGTESHKLGSVGGRTDWLAWSPDGASLRFSTRGQLRELALKGAHVHDLLPGWEASAEPCCGSWSPDGNFFYFLSKGQIWALDEQPRWLRKPSHEPMQLTSGPVIWTTPIPGHDGKKIFATGRNQRGEMSRYDTQSKEFQTYLAGVSADLLSYSKDGKYIAYISYPDGGLWKADRDGRNAVELVDPSLRPLLPMWSPDGSQIVFDGSSQKDETHLAYVISSQGGDAQRLLAGDSGPQTDPNWSPDGSQLVFSTSELGGRDPKSEIRLMDMPSHQITTLPGSQGMFSPRWSPDGRWIAASSFDQASISVFDIKAKRWTMLHKGIVAFPVWSADGRYLYVLTYVDDPGVFRIHVPDGAVERILSVKNFHYTGTLGSWLGLDPNDSPLMLRDIGTHDIYALTLEER